ncbi:hypothetical protein BC332_30479 [Capsicum chinense]|uniref:Uncharacterized protein n=1 Tax=Capsicum annuum TaxID=4072 RepID=A0A2G2Y7U4_CAPAN|nr:hypothetical protein T459_30184 [Capsicum annuum]PHU00692.1 hypothetical protein BC332_30479 [Capsicum chinense]
MIRKKVFLTYKRKRLPGSDLYPENGIPNTPSEFTKSKAVSPLLKEEERCENPSFKDEKKDFEGSFGQQYQETSGSTIEDNATIKVLSDINITLHDGTVSCFADSSSFYSN